MKKITKKERIEHFRNILNNSPLFLPLTGDAFNDVRNLLNEHPSSEEKIGCGIKNIIVRPNPVFPRQRSFWIQRTDGTVTDFSYLLCIDGKDRSLQRWFNSACRWAIEQQIISFKSYSFSSGPTVLCAMTGVPVNWKTCHVDHHAPTFAELVARFMAAENITLTAAMFDDTPDGFCEVVFADRNLTEKWRQFHKDNATLRVVSKSANLTRKRDLATRDALEAEKQRQLQALAEWEAKRNGR